MTRRADFLDINSVSLWVVLWFLAGIDGFKLLEPLRELGARPFFLFYIPLVVLWLARKEVVLRGDGLLLIAMIEATSALAFGLFGVSLAPFGDKAPFSQFMAHSLLFAIGFSPLAFRTRKRLELGVVVSAAGWALCIHLIFVVLDWMAILSGTQRPFEDSFLGSLGRDFPTGLFSEPSYFASFVAMVLPLLLYRSRLWLVVLATLVASAIFFLGDVRSFFMVYAGGILTMIVARWGLNWKAFGGAVVFAGLLFFVATTLNLLSVEENLSSAYRLGNTYSYLDRAISSDVVLGSGFGAAHFLYPRLDFPDFMYLSSEFDEMLGGAGNRVPVFNLWVRMFVEVGLVPVLLLLAELVRRLRRSNSDLAVRPVMVGAFMFSLSSDSYIYGMFTVALLLLYGMQVQPDTRTRVRQLGRGARQLDPLPS